MTKKILQFILCSFLLCQWACESKPPKQQIMESPNGEITVRVGLNGENRPYYLVKRNNEVVIDSSVLGLVIDSVDFSRNLDEVVLSSMNIKSDSYSLLHGKQAEIEYFSNTYDVDLTSKNKEALRVAFQISDDGVAFRYYIKNGSGNKVVVNEELSSYVFPQETKSWLQPMSKAKTGYKRTNPSYEENYMMEVPVSQTSQIGEGWVYPALFKSGENWMLITEADLSSSWCGTRLIYNKETKGMQVSFPQAEEIFPQRDLNPNSASDFASPWRIITIGKLATVVESTLGTDLAAPQIDLNTEFIQPGLASWSWIMYKDESINFETTLKYIDYASQMTWLYCLIDVNWDTQIGEEKMKELIAYGKEKGVKLLLWYNSSGSWNDTEYAPKSALLNQKSRQAEFNKIAEWGIAGIKVDFFGGDGQSMIAYYHDMLKDAADAGLLINFHGATLSRGWHRTYPNLMTVEAISGQEFITSDQGTADLQPQHCAMIPFARNVFDPMDFTPMMLDSVPGIKRRTTTAFEMALPVLFTSGVQHVAESPEGMVKMPSYVVDYLKTIPVRWDETRFVGGYPGKNVVLARRKGDSWFVVGINGENQPAKMALDLSFIDKQIGIGYFTSKENYIDKRQIKPNDEGMYQIELTAYDGFTLRF
ncbi:MAG: glycoside hydrolase family 97 catalytic domain-containing protein [Leeuwenhoekiella sp.]